MCEKIVFLGLMAWDFIGKKNSKIKIGDDVEGIITEKPGGVILNIALTFSKKFKKNKKFSLLMLSAVGNDNKGKKIINNLKKNNVNVNYIKINKGKTDKYIAIEGNKGLFAAIADTNMFKKNEEALLNYFYNGILGNKEKPFKGTIIIDGNVSKKTINKISKDKEFIESKIILVPASPKKCLIFEPLIKNRKCIIFLNLNEAKILCKDYQISQTKAANKLLSYGNKMIIITNQSKKVHCLSKEGHFFIEPVNIGNEMVTGLGDVFVSGFLTSYFKNKKNNIDKHLKNGIFFTSKHLKNKNTIYDYKK